MFKCLFTLALIASSMALIASSICLNAANLDPDTTLTIQNEYGTIVSGYPTTYTITAALTPTPTPTPNPTPTPTVTPTPTASPTPTGTPQTTTVYALGSNFCYCSNQSIGETTSANYIPAIAFDQTYQASHSTASDTAILLSFQISAGNYTSATLILTDYQKASGEWYTESGTFSTGREGIPIRRINGLPFTPAFQRYPTSGTLYLVNGVWKTMASPNEDPYDGGNWWDRVQTTGTTTRWSTLASTAPYAFEQHLGDLTTSLDPITTSTPRLNFMPGVHVNAVDITGYVRSLGLAGGGLLQLAIDPTNSTGPDRFGTSLKYKVLHGLQGNAVTANPTHWPVVRAVQQ